MFIMIENEVPGSIHSGVISSNEVLGAHVKPNMSVPVIHPVVRVPVLDREPSGTHEKLV
jgi:hypothetical protein